MTALEAFHGFEDSVRWRLTADGVEIEGSGLERTRGAPLTVTRIWDAFGKEINEVARRTRVPCHLLVACVATESGGKPDAVRLEPGYKSDAETPDRVSAGLMQTLISTARDTLQFSLEREWLLDSAHSILAGASYIARQARLTELDPPKVAAAYNAGRLYHQTGRENRWKMRQFPIGTGKHCDRFVQFFNDAVYVLARHNLKPEVDLKELLGGQRPRPVQLEEKRTPELRFATNANPDDVTPYTREIILSIARAAGEPSLLISSTARDPYNQARVMYDNLEKYGVEHQKKLYASAGDAVIDVYAVGKERAQDRTAIIRAMQDEILAQGPTNVSRHASDPRKLNVVDIAPSSVRDQSRFRQAVENESRVATFLTPPTDPGFHLEIPQPRGA